MTTLRTPRLSKRLGQTPDELLRPGIFGVQGHWPAWLECNFHQTLSGYRLQGVLPPLAKEGHARRGLHDESL